MKVLIAEDDPVYRLALAAALTQSGLQVQAVGDGTQALQMLLAEDAPKLAILDWVMPGLEGPEVCRQVRDRPTPEPPYLILLTMRSSKEDTVAGLSSGANDYVTKPFDRAELQARVGVGRTVVELQHILATRVRELEDALAQVKQLRSLLPICSYCKKIRDDGDYWQRVEDYIGTHAGVRFSHGICPACWAKEVQPQLDAVPPRSGAS